MIDLKDINLSITVISPYPPSMMSISSRHSRARMISFGSRECVIAIIRSTACGPLGSRNSAERSLHACIKSICFVGGRLSNASRINMLAFDYDYCYMINA